MAGTSSPLPLNVKEDERAITRSSGVFAKRSISSSASPSEKNSCSLSPVRFTNGSTAIDLP